MDRTRKIFLVIISIVFIIVAPRFIEHSFQTQNEQNSQATIDVLETLYQDCLASKNIGDLQAAYGKCGQLVSMSPNYADAQIQLIDVRKQLLHDYYSAGGVAFDQGLWEESIFWFDKVLELDLTYQDTLELKAIAMTNGNMTTSETATDTGDNTLPVSQVTPLPAPTLIIPIQDPIAFYPFNGNSRDESGYGNDGIVHGATLTEDRFGNKNSAYRFDGLNDYIEISSIPMLDLPNIGTVCAWYLFRAKNGDPNRTIVAKYKSDTSNEDGYMLIADQLNEETYNLRLYIKDNFANVSLSTDPPLKMINSSEWMFACLVIDNKTSFGFVNGELIGTGISVETSPGNPNPLFIGASVNNGSFPYNYFFGTIDDVLVYSRVLSKDEIQSLYHEGGWPIQ